MKPDVELIQLVNEMTVHGFFFAMGGLHVYDGDHLYCFLLPKDAIELVQTGVMVLPSAEPIHDCSKIDWVAKAMVLFQVFRSKSVFPSPMQPNLRCRRGRFKTSLDAADAGGKSPERFRERREGPAQPMGTSRYGR